MRLIILLLVLSTNLSLAQTTADFESFNLAQDTFLNGSDGSAGFDNGNIHLPNSYNEEWSSWSGWAISSMTDTATPGFTNQYSSISGGGADGSATYATTFVLGETLLSTTGIGKGVVDGFYINNATYAYLSMRDGDAFAKKFGGEMGTDPDFFYVSIKEHGRRNVNNDSLIFYLADFRFDDSAEDYIIDKWTHIPLGRFQNVDTLSFKLYSSDVGMFGMNTPAYFCIDNFTTLDMALTATDDVDPQSVMIYPNPTSGRLWIDDAENFESYSIHDISGRSLMKSKINDGKAVIDLWGVEPGTYILRLKSIGARGVSRLISKQ